MTGGQDLGGSSVPLKSNADVWFILLTEQVGSSFAVVNRLRNCRRGAGVERQPGSWESLLSIPLSSGTASPLQAAFGLPAPEEVGLSSHSSPASQSPERR